jgi:hypothetical protein
MMKTRNKRLTWIGGLALLAGSAHAAFGSNFFCEQCESELITCFSENPSDRGLCIDNYYGCLAANNCAFLQ